MGHSVGPVLQRHQLIQYTSTHSWGDSAPVELILCNKSQTFGILDNASRCSRTAQYEPSFSIAFALLLLLDSTLN
jgi:hypothetical protein